MITLGGFQQDMAALAKARSGHGKGGGSLTAAHAADQAAVAAECAGEGHCEGGPVAAEDARKSGPRLEPEPGTLQPGQFDRPYLDPGHAAPSPQSGPPCDFPVPQGQPAAEDFTRGYLQQGHAAVSPAARDAGMPQHTLSPVAQVHGAGPGADAIRAHMARYSMTSPSQRGGQ